MPSVRQPLGGRVVVVVAGGRTVTGGGFDEVGPQPFRRLPSAFFSAGSTERCQTALVVMVISANAQLDAARDGNHWAASRSLLAVLVAAVTAVRLTVQSANRSRWVGLHVLAPESQASAR